MVHSNNEIFPGTKKKGVIKQYRHKGNLKWLLLHERSQSEKAIYCIISSLWHLGKGKTMEAGKRSVVIRG